MELLPAPQVQMERIMQVLRETYALLRLLLRWIPR